MPTNKQEETGKHGEDEELQVELEPDDSDESAEDDEKATGEIDDDDIVDIDLDDLTAMEGPDA